MSRRVGYGLSSPPGSEAFCPFDPSREQTSPMPCLAWVVLDFGRLPGFEHKGLCPGLNATVVTHCYCPVFRTRGPLSPMPPVVGLPLCFFASFFWDLPSVGVMVFFTFSGSLSRWLRVVFRFPRLQFSSGKALLLTSVRRCRRGGAVVP